MIVLLFFVAAKHQSVNDYSMIASLECVPSALMIVQLWVTRCVTLDWNSWLVQMQCMSVGLHVPKVTCSRMH